MLRVFFPVEIAHGDGSKKIYCTKRWGYDPQYTVPMGRILLVVGYDSKGNLWSENDQYSITTNEKDVDTSSMTKKLVIAVYI